MKPVVLAAALLFSSGSLAAQNPDSALIYARLVEQNPDDSRAVFRLASLRPRGSVEAVALFERYVQLEPKDAWGHLALAEAYAAAGRYNAALVSVGQARELAPEEEDVAVTLRRIERVRRNAAPTLQPRLSITRDSDDNQLTQWTAAGEIAAGRATRLGLLVTQSRTSAGLDAFTAYDARASLQVRTPATRFELTAGDALVQMGAQYSSPVARARLRWQRASAAPLVDIRVSHAPVLISPLLMINRAMLSELRALVELPLVGIMRMRGNVQLGKIDTEAVSSPAPEVPGCTNRNPRSRAPGCPALTFVRTRNVRTNIGGGLVARISPLTELSASYYQLSYGLPVQDGYFAPRLLQAVEVGTYAEVYRLDPLTIAFDLGGGIQRSAAHGAELGDWTRALRGWSQLTLPLGRVFELNLESEAYSSQMDAVATSGSWSSVSAAVFLRYLIF